MEDDPSLHRVSARSSTSTARGRELRLDGGRPEPTPSLRAVVDVAETIARCFPDASERFSFLCALGSREIRDRILLNEYTYRGASFSIGRKNTTSLPPRRLLEAAGGIHVHGNTFRLTTLDPRAFGQLSSLSLTGVHVSAADIRSIAELQLRELSVRDSQLDVSIHALISMCDVSVKSLELESVLCCCGAWGTGLGVGRRRDVWGIRGMGVDFSDPARQSLGNDRIRGPCVHTMMRLEYLGLLGNVRCARRGCSCRISGAIRHVHMAKADDSVVETRELRDLERFRGAWSKSWMMPTMQTVTMDAEVGYSSSGCLRELHIEGDIDADDLLAVLVANAATLKMVSIQEGEVLRMTHACCRELVGAAKRGVKIDF